MYVSAEEYARARKFLGDPLIGASIGGEMTKKPDPEIEEAKAAATAKAAPTPAKKAEGPYVPETALKANRVFGAPIATGQG